MNKCMQIMIYDNWKSKRNLKIQKVITSKSNLKNGSHNSPFTVSHPVIYFSNLFLKKFIGFELNIKIMDFFFYIHRI